MYSPRTIPKEHLSFIAHTGNIVLMVGAIYTCTWMYKLYKIIGQQRQLWLLLGICMWIPTLTACQHIQMAPNPIPVLGATSTSVPTLSNKMLQHQALQASQRGGY